MGGIFAFAGQHADPQLLTRTVFGAAQQGPYGHGWVACTGRPEHGERHQLHIERHQRDLSDSLTTILAQAMTMRGGVLLGYTREHISRDPLQPLVADRYAIAHHGVISNPWELWPGPRDTPGTEAFLRAYDVHRRNGMPAEQALEFLAFITEQDQGVFAIADLGQLLVHHAGLTLFAYTDATSGTYVGGEPMHPDARQLEPGRVHVFTAPEATV